MMEHTRALFHEGDFRVDREAASHVKQYAVEVWAELGEETKKSRIRALNTVKPTPKEDEEVEYWVSKSGDTDVQKRPVALAKKPSQVKGSKRERTRKANTDFFRKSLNFNVDTDSE